MADRQVLVVGAGALGLSCADHLVRRPGVTVSVVDRAFPGSGSSGLSAGIFTRQYPDRESIEIRCRAVDLLEEHERELGLDLNRIGFLRLARDEADLDAFRRSAEIQHEFGSPDARPVDAEELARIVPDFDSAGAIGALYCPSDGYLDGAQLCTLLAERVQAQGGTLHVRTPVVGLSRGTTSKYLVRTESGDLPADVIVNATGAWGGIVGDALETPVGVVNERHEAFTFQLPDPPAQFVPMTLDYIAGSGATGLYFRQEGERQLLAGLHSNEILGHAVDDPDDYFRGVRQDTVEDIVARLARAFPGIENIGYQGGWSGLYPHSSHDRLVLGPHPHNADVIVGAGLGGIGLSMSPALGEILADWVTDGEPRRIPWAAKYVPPPA